MCASISNCNSPGLERQVIANVRRQCAALGVDLAPLSDDELYRILYTAWWLTVLDNRDADNPHELARSLRTLRSRQVQAGAA